MAIAGFGYSSSLISDSVATVQTELRAARAYSISYRVRYYALALVDLPLNSTLAENRALLAGGIRDLELNYNATVYGNAALDAQQILTLSDVHDALLFRPSCMRAPPAACYPATHPWYATSTQGLDTAVKSYIEEARLLLAEPDSEVSINNTHLNYVWAVGKNDLGGGLETLLALAYEDTLALIDEAQTIQIILLVVAFAMNVLFFSRYFMPWLARTMGESKRVAHLLSDLPPELSVEKILSEAFSTANDEDKIGMAAADAS